MKDTKTIGRRPAKRGSGSLCSALRGPARQQGAVVVIVMVFAAVFVVLGVSLYWLVTSQTRATEMERTDIKAFNVAEAGVDAGMLALKLNWPDRDDESVMVDASLLKTSLQTDNPGLWDPSRSSPSEFLQVQIYDNVDSTTGATTTVADPAAPGWDSNDDGRMFVDAASNVDDNRHRILVLAERQRWNLDFRDYALVSQTVDSNGQGLEVVIEDGQPPVYCDVDTVQHKGIDYGDGVFNSPSPETTGFDYYITDSMILSLFGIASSQGTYFNNDDPAARPLSEASGFLTSGGANGKVVYIKSNSAVSVGGNSKVGTVDSPVVVVIDTPNGSTNVWDMKGNADFYGILLVLGNSTLRGTCSVHGAVYCANTLLNKGNGSSPEIMYNAKVIYNINHQYVISVSIVPNTWEEYTVPRTESTVTGDQ
jgi:hypothetical protein